MNNAINLSSIIFKTVGFINFASQQNSLPVIEQLSVHAGENELSNVRLKISFEPEFADSIEVRYAQISSFAKIDLGIPNIVLRPAFFDKLTDRLKGIVRLELMSDDLVVSSLVQEISLLGRNQSPGLSKFFPEIIASFVLPRDPAVATVLRRAAQIIQDSKPELGLIGYQDGKRQTAAIQVEAIYKAIAEQGIAYVAHALTFENNCQFISTPSEVLQKKLGNCLDLTLLFASCFEEAGLNPLVVVIDGHSFVGCWLENKDFDEIASDSPIQLRKVDDLGEVKLLETTLICEGNSPSVAVANKIALESISDNSPKKFKFVIDIGRARRNGIRSIPNIGSDYKTFSNGEKYHGSVKDGSLDVRESLGERNFPQKQRTRIDQWAEKLLDLSLNNKLLNFKDGQKNYLPVLAPSIGRVEDIIAEGKALQILPGNGQSVGGSRRNQSVIVKEALNESLETDLKSGRIRSGLDEDEHIKKIYSIADEAKKSIEETGSNKLYLAVGVINWRSPKKPGVSIRAPLLLVPVEIKRKSALENYTIRKLEEETVINSSLIEMLKTDFGLEIQGLNPLPEDDSGIDVPLVLDIFRNAIRNMQEWEVKEEVWLGIFSFQKYLLWKDLTSRTEQLKGNRIVKHLIENSKQTFPQSDNDVESPELDKKYRPSEIMVTRSADSSQLAAVMSAAAGHDFVLQGPPGTGKSQTITNIIAQCLYDGKRVLFVAEKRAALEVVYKRLTEDGLSGFCLELHSNKIETTKVFAQFDEIAKLRAITTPELWDQTAEKLRLQRDKLNEYVAALHTKSPNGLSAYDCLTYIIPRDDLIAKGVEFDSSVLMMNSVTFNEVRTELEGLMRAYELIGVPCKHPLYLCEQDDWGVDPKAELCGVINKLCEAVKRLQSAVKGVELSKQLTITKLRYDKLVSYQKLMLMLAEVPSMSPNMLDLKWTDEVSNWFDRIIKNSEERILIIKTLTDFDEDKLTVLDAEDLIKKWDKSYAYIQPIKWLIQFSIRGRISAAHLHQKRPDVSNVSSILKASSRLNELRKYAEKSEKFASYTLGPAWNSRRPDPQKINQAKQWILMWNSISLSIAENDHQDSIEIKKLALNHIKLAPENVSREGESHKAIQEFIHAFNELNNLITTFTKILIIDEKVFIDSENYPATVVEFAEQIRGGLSEARNWGVWQRARKNCKRFNIGNFIKYIEAKSSKELPNISNTFETTFRSELFKNMVRQSPVLRIFNGSEHQVVIERFCDLDKKFTDLSKKVILAKLASRIPSASDKSEVGVELGKLLREVTKKSRRKPVRQLISEHSNVIGKVKPCFLMSPLSVAQFLDTKTAQFDIVVFDEASQIPVWDSIGAIARGKQLIVVGDPQQLPPTSFFASKGEKDGDDSISEVSEKLEVDEESILDELRAFQLKDRSLKWHYRSRKEGLIAFSNSRYYQNELLTFPSSDASSIGVILKYLPNAIYEKGESSTNPIEAKALVDEFLKRIRTKEGAKLSYGIVTFSLSQREVVLKCIEEARKKYSEIEEHFGDKCPVDGEPVFVKNLESVQGDERDVILFSICYGPDSDGKVSHNFGPITQQGGHRRLNVAVTRAKHEIVIFTCMKSDMIDLDRTASTGVRDLKGFLKFAEDADRKVANIPSTKDSATTKGLEALIAQRLISDGFSIRTNVGMSNYRIDIGVIYDKNPSKFILAIECDGNSYQNADTARDRDSLRQTILSGLGWRLHRVWSMDWWHNPEREYLRIREAILRATEAEDKKSKIFQN